MPVDDAAPAAARTAPRSRVLLVEDDMTNVLVATGALELYGCQVVTVSNGEQALDAVQAMAALQADGHHAAFDLVLMDYHMPVMNGLQATRAIRAWEARTRRPPLPIVAITASAMPDERKACMAAGMDDVLVKPFRFVEVSNLLQRWVPRPG